MFIPPVYLAIHFISPLICVEFALAKENAPQVGGAFCLLRLIYCVTVRFTVKLLVRGLAPPVEAFTVMA